MFVRKKYTQFDGFELFGIRWDSHWKVKRFIIALFITTFVAVFILILLISFFSRLSIGSALLLISASGIATLLSVALAACTLSLQKSLFAVQYNGMVTKVREAKNSALSAQITPHFIYQILNSATYRILKGDTTSSLEAISGLSELLRSVFVNSRSDLVTVQSELNTVKWYVSLEESRLGSNFTFRVICPEHLLHLHLPALFIQPLVENAIYHGGDTSKVNEVLLEIEDSLTFIRITISNSGRAFCAKDMARLNDSKSSALSVLFDRVQILRETYGDLVSINIFSNANARVDYKTIVTLTFPKSNSPYVTCANSHSR